MPSISKAQAEALAEGFLDQIGSGSTDDLQPRETISELFLLAGELIENSQNNLNRSNSNASGKLSASLIANEPEVSGGKIRTDIMMNFYGRLVNKGVKGTKSGSSTAGYAFKKDRPGDKFVDAIDAWRKRGKLSTANTNKKRTVSPNEKKNSSIADLDNNYAIARSIMQKGIKPTGFLDKAVQAARISAADRFGAAFKVDIINSITKP